MINLSDKKVIGFGASKNAYEIDNEQVILCSKRGNDKYIKVEFEMIKYLESFGLPTIQDVKIARISNTKTGSSIGLLQKKINKSKLFKPNGCGPILFSEINQNVLIKMHQTLLEHKIFIGDLQFIYNEDELYIIDPNKVYHIKNKFHLGHDRQRNQHAGIEIDYINQMRKLRKLIDFNLLHGSFIKLKKNK
jgi:hypothetical protein